MTDVYVDIGSCYTKIYWTGCTPRKCVYKTPLSVRKIKNRFDPLRTHLYLDPFLHKLSVQIGLLGTRVCVKVLVTCGDCVLFAGYVRLWFSVLSFGSCMAVDIHSWALGLHGSTDGFVVDVGYQSTRVTPVLDGTPVVEATLVGSGVKDFVEPFELESSQEVLRDELALLVVNLIDESISLCSSQTQRPFVAAAFLFSGAAGALEGLSACLRQHVLETWSGARVLIDRPLDPLLFSIAS